MDTNLKYNNVIVTGFGPFKNHAVNASWEAVKELDKLCISSNELSNVKVIVKEIPVSYEHAFAYVQTLWKEYSPLIVLHVGVSHKAKCLTMECCAHNYGYIRRDIHDKCPNETDIVCDRLKTGIDVKNICEIINKCTNENGCKACISHDAGRYLCEYIFYQSLCVDSKRTLFVHVPDLNTYSSLQTAKGLHDILCCMIKNLTNNQ